MQYFMAAISTASARDFVVLHVFGKEHHPRSCGHLF